MLDSIYVSEPDPLTMQASVLAWISCFGADDGLAYATAQGGNTTYTFTWSSNNQVGDTINTITPGTHIVTVVDNRGCTANDTVYMYEPDQLEIDISSNENIESMLIHSQSLDDIKDFINTMPEALKTAFTLRESEGKSYEEISIITETPIGTVRSRIFRARESIVDFMKKELISNE